MSKRNKSSNHGPQITDRAVVLFRHALKGDPEAKEALHRELGLKPWDFDPLNFAADDELLPEGRGARRRAGEDQSRNTVAQAAGRRDVNARRDIKILH
jgi:hypothetical protein